MLSSVLIDDPARLGAMAGEWKGLYRLRHGNLRVIYLLEENPARVVIAHLGSRGDVYK